VTRERKRIVKVAYLLFWPLTFLLTWMATFEPQVIEDYYTKGFSKTLAGYLSRGTGIFPFSVAEVMSWLFVVGLLVLLIGGVLFYYRGKKHKHKKKKSAKTLFALLYIPLVFLGVVYFCFNVVWGLNYYRLSFAEIAGFDVRGFSVQELETLCENLTLKANELRIDLYEDERGVIETKGGFKAIQAQAPTSFANASLIYPELGGNFGKPKPMLFSKGMSYTGISGIYFPFTGEANVNIDIPDVMLPATTFHEMAHQRGFAREDEASYIAWVVGNHSDDPLFRYSGTVYALIYAMNALYSHDPEKAAAISDNYGEGLRRDLQDISAYWKQYEGRVEEFTEDVNDAYLKSNRQEEGVQSYGRMVDLLLAEQRTESHR